MVTARKPSLYLSLIDITDSYLGPAAERFISRQIRNHLNKKPENITLKDIEELKDWLKIAMNVLTNDTVIVKRYIESLNKLIEVNEK